MNDVLKIVLQKLETIEARIKTLEKKENVNLKGEEGKIPQEKKDPLFNQAWEVILKQENDVSADFLAEQLEIPIKRAEAIMDQLEAAGFGVCYTKEV